MNSCFFVSVPLELFVDEVLRIRRMLSADGSVVRILKGVKAFRDVGLLL